MDQMRADMGGAACVAGSLLSVAKLGIPINIKGINYKNSNNDMGGAACVAGLLLSMAKLGIDMGGAACVAGSLLSVAKLGIPISILKV